MKKIGCFLIISLLFLGYSLADEKTDLQEEAMAKIKQLQNSLAESVTALKVFKTQAYSGDKTIVPKVVENIKTLLEELDVQRAIEIKTVKAKKKVKGAKNPPNPENEKFQLKEDTIDTIEELVGVLCDLKTDNEEVREVLYRLIRGERAEPRLGRVGIYALGELGMKGIFREYLSILQDDGNNMHRREFIWACAKSGEKAIIPILGKFLPDETPAVRGIIAMSFWSMKARAYGFQLLNEAKYEQNIWVKEKYEWAGKKLSN